MNWQSFKEWVRNRTATLPAQVDPPSRGYLLLDDRQKAVYAEWKTLWGQGGNLAITMELEQRIYELEKEKNK